MELQKFAQGRSGRLTACCIFDVFKTWCQWEWCLPAKVVLCCKLFHMYEMQRAWERSLLVLGSIDDAPSDTVPLLVVSKYSSQVLSMIYSWVLFKRGGALQYSMLFLPHILYHINTLDSSAAWYSIYLLQKNIDFWLKDSSQALPFGLRETLHLLNSFSCIWDFLFMRV